MNEQAHCRSRSGSAGIGGLYHQCQNSRSAWVSGIEVDCSGLGSKWDKCYKRAAKECKGAGYQVVARSDDLKEVEEEDGLFGFNPAGFLTRTMLVICR